jgi:peptide/nickel transport system permease protein
MFTYIARRLLLLPLTLFLIILTNFIIVNLAPGEPVTVTEISQEGATRKEGKAFAFGADDRYLQFREHYGLTLPILFNTWPWITAEQVQANLWTMVNHRRSPDDPKPMPVKEYDAARLLLGDQARFVMRHLIAVIVDTNQPMEIRRMAARFFIRGGTRQAVLGPSLTESQKQYNRKISHDNTFLRTMDITAEDTPDQIDDKVRSLKEWYVANKDLYRFELTTGQKVYTFFFETRFCRYMGRVLTLDFGTLRNDPNKTVISEVVRRFKYSLTLALIPMIISFFLCQILGFTMALNQNRWPDYVLNVMCLILYAIPVFVVAPFLIEKIALYHNFPFTNTPIPVSGFTSPERIYGMMTSKQRLFDVIQHIALPLIAVMYGGLAADARLSRTAILEVLRQDYVRTARAKGLPRSVILIKHVGRNAAVTIVTSIAGSLGIVLGGSLIVETMFGINGFGKFFYDAVVNRDYNVIMFSALSGAFLTLVGYLVADITYTVLDPRVTLD